MHRRFLRLSCSLLHWALRLGVPQPSCAGTGRRVLGMLRAAQVAAMLGLPAALVPRGLGGRSLLRENPEGGRKYEDFGGGHSE